MKDRVKVLLAGTSAEHEGAEHVDVPSDPGTPRQALQVLALAQRTAEEHVASAHHQADKIRGDARAQAEQIARDAQVHAHNVRREGEKVLSDARAAAAQIARDAQARAEEARRNAEKIMADARAHAEAMAADAQTNAEELKLQAQQRYEDVVGSLATKREALQQQIEALEVFDRDYRSRLTAFMQGQLRALWVDQPQVNAELETHPQHAELSQHAEQAQHGATPQHAGTPQHAEHATINGTAVPTQRNGAASETGALPVINNQ
jgi:cell division septum initiation protein DivIVA